MTHHIHPDPAVRALVERAKAEAWDEGYHEGWRFESRAKNPYRADYVAAQPAPEAATVEAKRRGVHLFIACWCGSGHDWEKAKHGTVNGLTERQVAAALSVRRKP